MEERVITYPSVRAQVTAREVESYYPTETMGLELEKIRKMKEVKSCPVLEWGLRATEVKMPYYYCSCDPNKMYQLCVECAKTCHNGHVITEQPPAFINCSCGERGHELSNETDYDYHYQNRCFYHEISRISKVNIYYSNSLEHVCMFCYNFCNTQKNYTKNVAESPKEVPDCLCTHENHEDLKFIFNYTNEMLGRDIADLKPIQILNLLYLSQKSFQNIYAHSCDNRETKILNNKKINMTNYFFTIQNFSIIASKLNSNRYVNSFICDIFDDSIIKSTLEQGMQDHISFWSFIKCLMTGYLKITIGRNTVNLPKFKIMDLENLSSFQRLCLFHNKHKLQFNEFYTKSVKGESGVIINLLLALEHINKTKFSHIEAIDTLYVIVSGIYRLSLFYFLTRESMIRVCYELIKTLRILTLIRTKGYNRDETKYIPKELKLFCKIIKTMHIFCFIYNDKVVLDTVMHNTSINKINIENQPFLYTKNDLGKGISKITINLLNILTKEYMNDNKEKEPIFNKIIRHGQQILAILVYSQDAFIISLRKNLKNYAMYESLLKNENLNSSALEVLKDQTDFLESSYYKFFNFEIDKHKLEKEIAYTINKFIELQSEHDPSELKKLLYQCDYLFSLVKAFKIINLIELDKENLIEKILTVIKFFAEDDADNVLICLSKVFFNCLISLPRSYAVKNFQFFLECFITLAKNNEEMNFTKHFLKSIWEYFLSLNDDFEDKYVCLDLLLKIMDLVLNQISSLNFQMTITKAKQILMKIHEKYDIISLFVKFLCSLGKDFDFFSIEDYDEDKKQPSRMNTPGSVKFELNMTDRQSNMVISNSLAFNIFYLFIKLINKCFDNSNSLERQYLNNLFQPDDFIKILQNKSLNLFVRTEIIKYLRKTYIDVYIAEIQEAKNSYIRAFLSNYTNSKVSKNLDFLRTLIEISDRNSENNYFTHNFFDMNLFQIFNFELKNFKEICNNNKYLHKDSIKNYFENGLVIPLHIYINKLFSIIPNLCGKELLYLYELTINILEMKQYFVSSNIALQFADDEENINDHNIFLKKDQRSKTLQSDLMRTKKILAHENMQPLKHKKTLVDHTVFHNGKGLDISYTIDLMKGKKFKAFDYAGIIEILGKHFFNIIHKHNSMNLLNHFDSKEANMAQIMEKAIAIKGAKLDDKLESKLLLLCLIYEKGKGDLNNSCLMQNLTEICVEYEASYRNLLLKYLIFISLNDSHLRHDFSVLCNYILFNLLQSDTSVVQTELVSLLEENPKTLESSGFLESFADILFTNLISIFISNYNPGDKIWQTHYLTALNIIKIFKYLCEEHNNFFQTYLIRKLKFDYIDDRGGNEKIKFFDFMLFTLVKILTIANWQKHEKTETDEHIDYLYDLYSAIIELLIEVVQGNTSENLSYLEVSSKDGVLMEKRRSNLSLEQVSSKCAFETFLDTIKGIIFNNHTTNTTLYYVRSQTMEFLIAILEEKNCTQQIKNHIMEHLNIEKIINTVSHSLKRFFLNKTKSDPMYDNLKHKYTINKTMDNSESLEANRLSYKVLNTIKFDYEIYNFIKNQYFVVREGFPESLEFNIANTFYKYFKIVSTIYDNETATVLINRVKEIDSNKYFTGLKTSRKKATYDVKSIKLITENEQLIDDDFVESYFIIKFFEEITKTVEVVNDKEDNPTTVIFTILPSIHHLSKDSKQEFEYNVNRENQYTKLYNLCESTNYFKEEIEYNSNGKKSKLFRLFMNMNYSWIQVILFLLVLCLNFFILATLEGDMDKHDPVASAHHLRMLSNDHLKMNYEDLGTSCEMNRYLSSTTATTSTTDTHATTSTADTPTSTTDTHATTSTADTPTSTADTHATTTDDTYATTTDESHATTTDDTIQAHIVELRHEMTEKVQHSIEHWRTVFVAWNIVLIAFCTFFIITWLWTKLPLYYQMEKGKYCDKNNKKEEELSRFNKTIILLQKTILGKDQIGSLIFMTIIGILAIVIPHAEIYYCITLIAIVNLNSTLRNIIIAVKLKWMELFLTLVLALFLIWSITSVGFYFLHDDFATSLESREDNYCDTFIFCFLTHIDYGLRLRGGVGEMLYKRSIEWHGPRYAARLFFDMVYFLILVVLMLELVFGIIIETFRELRIEEHRSHFDKMNICFICGVSKDDLEKDKKNFVEHCEKDHNVWNYVNYMVRLKFSNPHDLNAINSYTLELINKKNITWFPIYKSKEKEITLQKEKEDEFIMPEALENKNHEVLK